MISGNLNFLEPSGPLQACNRTALQSEHMYISNMCYNKYQRHVLANIRSLSPVETWWHTVTHGRGSEGETGEWSGYPVPFTLPRDMVYPALLPLIRTRRLPVVNWTDAPAGLNGLVRFAERRNLVSACVPSHFKCSLLNLWSSCTMYVVYSGETRYCLQY